MIRRWTGLLLLVSAIFNVAFLAGFVAARWQSGQPLDPPDDPGPAIPVVEELGLTDVQKQQYQTMRSDALQQAADLQEEIFLARQELWSAMSSETADPQQIRDIQERLGDLYRQSRELNAVHLREFTELLTPEQRKKLAEAFRQHHDRRRGPSRFMERFDRNKNGVLDQEEKERVRDEAEKYRESWTQRREAFKKRFDVDDDGELSREEWAAAREAAIRERFKQSDTNGDGVLDREEARELLQFSPSRRSRGDYRGPRRDHDDRPEPPDADTRAQ